MAKLLVTHEGVIAQVVEDTDPVPAFRYSIVITDKTVQEAQDYLEQWRNQPVITQLQHDTQTHLRRLRVDGGMVSVSGKNAMTQRRFTVIQGELESAGFAYSPDAQYVSHTNDSITFDLTVEPADVAAAEAIIENEFENMVDELHRWRVKPTSLDWLANNGGTVSGTASEVSVHLQDGLLL